MLSAENKNRKRSAAYCRVSTEKDAQLESLENQKSFFEDFASRSQYELTTIYADEGISGKQMKNRAQFLQMLSDARRGLFDVVLVKDISRFARNTVDFLNAVRELRGLRIEVLFLSNNQTILGNSEFILTIFSALAQEESANLSSRVKFGKRVNAKKGRVPNLIYGYEQMDTFHLSVDEEEAKNVRMIFDLYVHEGYGSRKIALTLTQLGIPTKKDAAQWMPKTVRRILMNPIYAGTLINNRYETVDFLTGKQVELPPEEYFVHSRPELQIVDPALFQKAREIMIERRRQYKGVCAGRGGRYSSRHLFSTLIRCEHCGYSFSRMSHIYAGGKRKWKCAGNNQFTSDFCPNSFLLDEDELAEQIHAYFLRIIEDQSRFEKAVLDLFNSQAADKLKACRIQKAEKQLAKAAHTREKYKTMYANDFITLQELKDALAKLDGQCAACRSELDREKQMARESGRFPYAAQGGMHPIRDFLHPQRWTNPDLREIIEKVAVQKDGEVSIYFKRLNMKETAL